jgi:hypothetical protein
MAPRSLIPSVQHDVRGDRELVFWLVTGVFAIEAGSKDSMASVWKLWDSPPTGQITVKSETGITLNG